MNDDNEAKRARAQEKRRADYIARKDRLMRAQLALTKRHVLCVERNIQQPVTIDDTSDKIPVGTRVLNLFEPLFTLLQFNFCLFAALRLQVWKICGATHKLRGEEKSINHR